MHNNILIVDDNPTNNSFFKEALGHAWGLKIATSMDEAFQVLEEEDIKLILLDVIFNGASAFDFMLKLSESKRLTNIPIVYMTSMEERHQMHKAMKLGGSGYIFKPLAIQEIQMTVRNQMKMMGE